MSHPVKLPTPVEILAALAQLRTSSNRPVTARALAEHVGLTNSTFWRHFPEIAQSVADERREALRGVSTSRAPATTEPAANAERRLRDENTALRSQLERAVAHIQRLTIENDDLRKQAEQASGIRGLRSR